MNTTALFAPAPKAAYRATRRGWALPTAESVLRICAGVAACSLAAASPAPPTAWNVQAAGAAGDGREDCTAVFQQALDAAGKAGGGVVDVPAGRFRIAGNLIVPANVTLRGISRVPPTPGPLRNLTGSVLLAYAGRGSAQGLPFIRLAGNNAVLAGLVIAYPEWKQSDVPPVPYPPCVLSEDTENVGITECCLLNPYEGIRLVRAHRHLVRNVTGYPIWRGLFVDQCYDIGHIENVHYWPFGVVYRADDPYCRWVNLHGVAFELARTDWHYIQNTFCFGYGVGYKFSAYEHGSANGNFLGLGADSCERAVLVERAQAPGLLFCNGEFVGRWSSTNSVCVEIGPEAEGKVSLVNCSFWGPIDRCVWMRSGSGQFTASACNFVDWDNAELGSPAIQLDAGRAIVQASTFLRGKLHVLAGSNVVSAILTANQAEEGFRVRNLAGARTQAALNEADGVIWTEAARLNYEIRMGGKGSGRYLEGWHGAENGSRSFRWSRSNSRFVLPVVPGKPYTLAIEAFVPPQAKSEGGGLYLGGNQIAPLAESALSKVVLPAASGDQVELELRCQGWVPQKLHANSSDPRVLGVQVFQLRMQSGSPGGAVFDANTGEWITPARRDSTAP